MVFRNEKWNGTGDIVVYGHYHPYWINRDTKEHNPKFDVYSGKILDLKEGNPSVIRYFYNILDSEINPGITICVVPSSNPDNINSGIAQLGKMLAANERKDRVYYLQRSRKIPKLSNGGDRSTRVHFQSISTLDEMEISGDIVLLMDDITTTGNSLYACRDILIDRGAEVVEMFALGKTVWD